MLPTHRPPGEILLEDFLKPVGVSQVALAEHFDTPSNASTSSFAASERSHQRRLGCSPAPRRFAQRNAKELAERLGAWAGLRRRARLEGGDKSPDQKKH